MSRPIGDAEYDGKTFKELLGMLTNQVVDVFILQIAPPDPDGLQAALRRTAIREASAGVLIIPELMPDEPIPVQAVFKSFPAGNYHLIPTDDVPPWYGLLATPEELKKMKETT